MKVHTYYKVKLSDDHWIGYFCPVNVLKFTNDNIYSTCILKFKDFLANFIADIGSYSQLKIVFFSPNLQEKNPYWKLQNYKTEKKCLKYLKHGLNQWYGV